jgi:heptosyltransferase-2
LKRILLIQTAFIGDAILATATLSSLKALGFEVDVLVRSGNEIFFNNHPDCNQVIVWDKNGAVRKYSSLFRMLSETRRNKYHAVVNLQRFAATGLLTAFSGAKYKLGFSQNPFSFAFSHSLKHSIKKNYHESHRNLDLLHLAFPNAQHANPNLFLTADILKSVNAYKKRKYVCLFPGSVWFTKRLSNEKWLELILLLPKDYTVYFLGAPNEEDLCDKIISQATPHHSKLINLCGKMNLMQSAALGKDAEMNYCNDSSPVHFLSAVNANISAFFLSTSPIFGFYPVSENAKIQQTTDLPCKPCGMVGKEACPKEHFNCDKLIDIKTHIV